MQRLQEYKHRYFHKNLNLKLHFKSDINYILNLTLGCDVKHGRCIAPNLCACDYGWTGPRCNKCIPLPGCRYGHCETEAFECICDDNLRWAGAFCDKRKLFIIKTYTFFKSRTLSYGNVTQSHSKLYNHVKFIFMVDYVYHDRYYITCSFHLFVFCVVAICRDGCLHGRCNEPHECM